MDDTAIVSCLMASNVCFLFQNPYAQPRIAFDQHGGSRQADNAGANHDDIVSLVYHAK